METAVAIFNTIDQRKLFDRMHEVLRSLKTLTAVYKYVLKYKAEFQQEGRYNGRRRPVPPHTLQVFGQARFRGGCCRCGGTGKHFDIGFR